jgi:5-oxoprolinase (ATP-hydrolysing)
MDAVGQVGIERCRAFSNTLAQSYERTFIDNYKREYGFELRGRSVLVDDIRVRAVGHSDGNNSNTVTVTKDTAIVENPIPTEIVSVYFENGRLETPVHYMQALLPNMIIQGPAIIVQLSSTVMVEPACRAIITTKGDIEIVVEEAVSLLVTTKLDPIYLSIFSHRFMGIAEQMGRTLQRTSISVNIKERLDFSCALFDPLGGLVANAPHLPVHLGAMSAAVIYQQQYWGKNILEGDVLVSNHPQLAGGSHLPDITVITPIFVKGEIVFYVASRGHHADVGGIAPGSMPPLSKTLVEEGAAIIAFKLVENGVFQEQGNYLYTHIYIIILM